MQKVIVTGKNGMISRAVCKALIDDGYHAETISLRGSQWKELNFSDSYSIVHVAGVVPKAGVTKDDYYEINYKLTEEFAKKAKADGVKHFVYISSMAVYGITPAIKKGRGVVYADTPCNPSSDYGKSKLHAENALNDLKDVDFNITVIRVPSVYGVGKTEYLEQYKYSFGRLKKIPEAFTDRYKSIINVENLSRLICLIIKNKKYGLVCPDDGRISAFDLCSAIMKDKKSSKTYGLIVKLFRSHPRVVDYYGEVCYDEKLTDIFSGEYRAIGYNEMIEKVYGQRN